jgi:cathepsin E
MLLGFSLAPFFALANAIAANPLIVRDSLVSLPLARYINASGAIGDLVRRDRERAKSFMKPSNTLTSELTSNVEVTNAVNFYTASIGVGTPSTYCESG